jgi:hypothetical protein
VEFSRRHRTLTNGPLELHSWVPLEGIPGAIPVVAAMGRFVISGKQRNSIEGPTIHRVRGYQAHGFGGAGCGHQKSTHLGCCFRPPIFLSCAIFRTRYSLCRKEFT